MQTLKWGIWTTYYYILTKSEFIRLSKSHIYVNIYVCITKMEENSQNQDNAKCYDLRWLFFQFLTILQNRHMYHM